MVTRMLSSRMRTARQLTISRSARGVCLQVVSAGGWVSTQGWVSAFEVCDCPKDCWDTPPTPMDRILDTHF